MNPKSKYMTCITQVSKHTLEETERAFPNAKPPWRPSEVDFNDRIKLFIAENLSSKFVKEYWANDHMELITEEEHNPDSLFVYSDGSLREKGEKTLWIQSHRIQSRQESFQEKRCHRRIHRNLDAEMAGLHAATAEAR